MPVLTLRDYQVAAVEEARKRNLLVVLPTNSGKTLISAKLIEHTLYEENERELPEENSCRRKIIFLAPVKALAHQQAKVLLEQIGPLQEDEAHVAGNTDGSLWRLGLVVGGGELTMREAARTRQVVVSTPQMFEQALIEGQLKMVNIALLVLDEAHHTRGVAHYQTMLEYFYLPCEARPRVLALTASPVDQAQEQTPDVSKFLRDLNALEARLDCGAWSRPVDEKIVPHAHPIPLQYQGGAAPSELSGGVLEALRTALPTHAAITAKLREAFPVAPPDELESHVEALVTAWIRVIESIERAGELGPWAYFRAAEILVTDLGKGTRRLSAWLETDDDEPPEHSSVGGTKAHAELLATARAALEEGLGALSRPSPIDSRHASPKMIALLAHLHARDPKKCIVFATARVTCQVHLSRSQTANLPPLSPACCRAAALHEGMTDTVLVPCRTAADRMAPCQPWQWLGRYRLGLPGGGGRNHPRPRVAEVLGSRLPPCA